MFLDTVCLKCRGTGIISYETIGTLSGIKNACCKETCSNCKGKGMVKKIRQRNYWIYSDFHPGHNELIEKNKRLKNFNDIILDSMDTVIDQGDVLICLGDIYFGFDAKKHGTLIKRTGSNIHTWLLLGDCDNKSISRYLDHGWHWVGHEMLINIYGHSIVFSYKPIRLNNFNYTLNIYGCCCDNELAEDCNDARHYFVSLEKTKFQPVNLKAICDSIKIVDKNIN